MDTFLKETARELWRRYGEEVSSLRIVFPSRRARLFFNEALVGAAGRPIWQPGYGSIDELMETVSGIRRSDPLRLVAELYTVYSGYHTETFDSFFFWGDMLLADFDSVDKYRIDARTLFLNLSDLKAIETDLSYLSPEQVGVIRRFWSHFRPDDPGSPEKKHFAGIWNTLYDIYTAYRERLQKSGMAYPGMIYREAADILRNESGPFEAPGHPEPGRVGELLRERYVFIGFNALSETEKTLFDFLRRRGRAEFYWDYDVYYTGSEVQESGMFIRENLGRYGDGRKRSGPAHFAGAKEIRAVGAPSDAMQCRYVTEFLKERCAAGEVPDKNTAIVLTDENLLLPVLHSIPPEVEKVNVTMGYPLRQTPAYTFIERLIGLQQRKKGGSRPVFYHGDVTGLLNHPFVRATEPHRAEQESGRILRNQTIYVSPARFAGSELLEMIFTPVEGWRAICDYLVGVSDRLQESFLSSEEYAGQREYLSLAGEEIRKIRNNFASCGIEATDDILLSLIRKVLQKVRIPYEGEPLEGVQVMGILETRTLDFENVLILSMNDDTFPGNLSATSSFIPYNLRFAYGLPTPRHHEGVYAYYFYRLIQRAKRVVMVYSTKSDDRKTGEPSRYIYQLDYESPHKVVHTRMAMEVNAPPVHPVVIPKDAGVRRELDRYFRAEDGRTLSPSAASAYIECPVRFYYRYIAGLDEAHELTEEVDLPMFGNIFHKAAEMIYRGCRGRDDTGEYLRAFMEGDGVDRIVEQAVRSEYFKDEEGTGADAFGGNLRLVAGIVKRYLVTCLLDYDTRNPDFTVRDVELWLDSEMELPGEEGPRRVRLVGKADRVDLLPDGRVRIVDYKTGSLKIAFKGVEALFSGSYADRNPAVFQTFLYSMMVARQWGAEVAPSLYFIRFMNGEDYSPYPGEIAVDEDRRKSPPVPVVSFSGYRTAFEEKFREKLVELFDPDIPFRQCSDLKTCSYCSYSRLCGR